MTDPFLLALSAQHNADCANEHLPRETFDANIAARYLLAVRHRLAKLGSGLSHEITEAEYKTLDRTDEFAREIVCGVFDERFLIYAIHRQESYSIAITAYERMLDDSFNLRSTPEIPDLGRYFYFKTEAEFLLTLLSLIHEIAA